MAGDGEMRVDERNWNRATGLAGGLDMSMRERRATLSLAASLLAPSSESLKTRDSRHPGCWIVEPHPGSSTKHSRQWEPDPLRS